MWNFLALWRAGAEGPALRNAGQRIMDPSVDQDMRKLLRLALRAGVRETKECKGF